jgi:hypothetical protein
VFCAIPERVSQLALLEDPHATGSYTRFLNLQVAILLALQLTLCAVCAAIAWWWRKNHGYARFHLVLHDYNQVRWHSLRRSMFTHPQTTFGSRQ